jgi:hypothetical protein
MPWAQSVEAFQKHFETGNSLRSGLADPPANAVVFPIGINLGRSKSPESIKLLRVLRQTPRHQKQKGVIPNLITPFASCCHLR